MLRREKFAETNNDAETNLDCGACKEYINSFNFSLSENRASTDNIIYSWEKNRHDNRSSSHKNKSYIDSIIKSQYYLDISSQEHRVINNRCVTSLNESGMDGIAVAKSEKGLTATRDTFPSMGSRHRCDAIVRSTLSARADKTAASLASFHDSVSPFRAHSFLHFFLLSISRATVYHPIISTERLFFSHCYANHDRLRPIRVIKDTEF